MDGPVGAGVELEGVRLVAVGAGCRQDRLLGVLHQVLQTRLRDDPANV